MTMAINTRYAIVLALCLSSAACVDFTGEAPEVCIVREDLQFLRSAHGAGLDGAVRRLAGDAASASAEPVIEKTLVFDELDEIEDLLDIHGESELVFQSIQLRTDGAGGVALSGLESMSVSVRSIDLASGLPEVDIFGCAPGQCAVEGDTFHASSQTSVDIIPYLESGGLEFRFQLSSSGLPAVGWQVDLEICMAARVAVQATL